MWRMSTTFCVIALFTATCELVTQAGFSTLTQFQTFQQIRVRDSLGVAF